MATTTNYSWTTPDDTALVKDGAAAIRSLGTAIDTTVFNNAGAAIAKTLIDAEGDLIVGDAADAVQRLAVGSNGQVLTVDTTVDGKVKWATPAGGGKVLQVVYAMYDTETTIATSTFTDTGLSASITPSSTSSKVYIFANTGVYSSKNTTTSGGIATKLFRGATEIFVNDSTYAQAQFISAPSGSGYAVAGYIPLQYLGSPSTTSSTTYKIQGSAGGSGVFQRLGLKSNIILMEIGA